jgi:hypothetical protein
VRGDAVLKQRDDRGKFNPGRCGGKRNIFCPYYSVCLDFAVQEQWVSWGCKDCEHRFNESGRAELQSGREHAVVYYEVGIRI